jgi:hypothetical protein
VRDFGGVRASDLGSLPAWTWGLARQCLRGAHTMPMILRMISDTAVFFFA